MNIQISLATLYGNNLHAGDEIGVFDGEKCVGTGVLTEELTGAPLYLGIEVPREFHWWDGFTPGDTILYRFCSGGVVVPVSATPTYISNGPTFDPNGSCVVELRIVNTAPCITSVPVTEAQPGQAYSYTVTADDMEGDPLTYKALVLPGWLVFNESTHTLAATPGEDDVGDQHVSIRVSDGSLHTDHTFIITVNMGNHAPVITSSPPASAVPGDNYQYTITALDADHDSLSYTAPVIPDWLSFNQETQMLSGVPQSADLGCHHISLRVSDGQVSAEQNFPILVENANIPPGFTSIPPTFVSAGDPYTYHAEAVDADGDELRYSAPTLPAWLNFDATAQNLHGIPTNDVAGTHQVVLQVTDGEGTGFQNFDITVDFVYGMEDLVSEEHIFIRPNPTGGKFRLELPMEPEEEITLEILDSMGKVLLQQIIYPYVLMNEEFNLTEEPAGLYIIRVYNTLTRCSGKLIIR